MNIFRKIAEWFKTHPLNPIGSQFSHSEPGRKIGVSRHDTSPDPIYEKKQNEKKKESRKT